MTLSPVSRRHRRPSPLSAPEPRRRPGCGLLAQYADALRHAGGGASVSVLDPNLNPNPGDPSKSASLHRLNGVDTHGEGRPSEIGVLVKNRPSVALWCDAPGPGTGGRRRRVQIPVRREGGRTPPVRHQAIFPSMAAAPYPSQGKPNDWSRSQPILPRPQGQRQRDEPRWSLCWEKTGSKREGSHHAWRREGAPCRARVGFVFYTKYLGEMSAATITEGKKLKSIGRKTQSIWWDSMA